VNNETQKAIADFGELAFDAIHELQRAIRECYARIEQLERDNEALRLRLAQEQETAEW
jgi:hypothetical protein